MDDQHGFRLDVVVVGGAGHVGFPLALAFASRGLKTCIHDVNAAALEGITSGRPPFFEPGADEFLREALRSETLIVSEDPRVVSQAEHVIVVVGTPIDEHLSPDPDAVPETIHHLAPFLRAGQLVVLRSTVFPGVTRRVHDLLNQMDLAADLAFCPERIAEGRALTELFELPQLVAAYSPIPTQRAASLFGKLSPSIVELAPEEAELAKLFTNAWRYIKFAAANQFFMMCNDEGVDFATVRSAMAFDYPRAADMPMSGFAAGPCLFKDTMQLAAMASHQFPLGHAAMVINEGLPGYLVSRLKKLHPLRDMTVGVLGMAFKAETDDTRSSLSYKLKRELRFASRRVMTTDPYVTTDSDLFPLEQVMAQSDLLIIGAPHEAYRNLATALPVVDVWGLLNRGTEI